LTGLEVQSKPNTVFSTSRPGAFSGWHRAFSLPTGGSCAHSTRRYSRARCHLFAGATWFENPGLLGSPAWYCGAPAMDSPINATTTRTTIPMRTLNSVLPIFQTPYYKLASSTAARGSKIATFARFLQWRGHAQTSCSARYGCRARPGLPQKKQDAPKRSLSLYRRL
jgi:hypothetical protein